MNTYTNDNAWTFDLFDSSNENSASTTLLNLVNQINSKSFYNFMTFAAPKSSIDSHSSSLSTSSSSLSCSYSPIVGSACSNLNISKSLNNDSFMAKSCDFSTPPPPGFQPLGSSLSNKNSNSKTKLFVGNLPSDTLLEELISLFSKYGRVNEQLCIVKQDHYAFIHFYTEAEAVNALNNLNNSLFKNRYIRVQYSTSYGHIKKSKSMFYLNFSFIYTF